MIAGLEHITRGTVQIGDQVITPLNAPDSATVVNITGKILGIGPDQIDHVNAHATSTVIGDKIEAATLRHVFAKKSRCWGVRRCRWIV